MNNNDIFKKLRVPHKFTNEDIIAILKLVDYRITATELGAFFRSEDHQNFRPCGDQVLRNFLNGLIIHLRGPMEKKPATERTEKPERVERKPIEGERKKSALEDSFDKPRRPRGSRKDPRKKT